MPRSVPKFIQSDTFSGRYYIIYSNCYINMPVMDSYDILYCFALL